MERTLSIPSASRDVARLLDCAKDILDMIAEISSGSGIELSPLAKHFHATCRRLKAERKAKPASAEHMAPNYLTRVSEVLAEWFNDRLFCSGAGHPALLPWSGKRSFKELIRRVLPEAKADSVRDVLLRSGAVVREKGRYRAVRRLVFTTADTQFARMQALTSVRGYLRTSRHNMFCTNPADRVPERKTANLSIPLREVVPMRRLTQQELGRALETLDDALRERQVVPGGEPTTSVHIGIYAYEEPFMPYEELQDASSTRPVASRRRSFKKRPLR